jgi:hypothetical protein
MTQLSLAEQGNYNWLKSVMTDSNYTKEFKFVAQKNIEKFEKKMRLVIWKEKTEFL